MICAKCGTPLPPDAGFCRACGAFVRPRGAPGNAQTTPSVSPPAVVPAPTVPRAPWPVVPERAWTSVPISRPSPPPGTVAAPSMLGDLLAVAGAGFVLISIFLTWYSVTLTTLGVQFYESLERAILSRLFPQIANSIGGLSGPLTFSVPALGSGAGGWRWAILVVSIILLLEVLLAIGSSARSQSAPSWPHTSVLLLLSASDLILVLAAFLSRPYSSAPASYLSVGLGVGAYVGLFAALLACAGAVIGVATRTPGGSR